MLDRTKHQLVMKQLLREVFSDQELSAQLVFKGGTSLMLFHGLDRFSTDLDFDLRSGIEGMDFQRLQELALKHIAIKDAALKKNTCLIKGSYEVGMQQIKIEVSIRSYPQSFTIFDFLGLSVPVLSEGFQLAHKLCAISSRKTMLNRDIYDADFMLKKNWEPNAQIIELRTGQSPTGYYQELLKTTEEASVSKNIMIGLGEVLSQKERTWAQQNLIKSFREQLLLRL